MSAATITRLADREACHRLNDLVAQLEGLCTQVEAGDDVIERLDGLQERVTHLAEDVQASRPWVIHGNRYSPEGRVNWNGRATKQRQRDDIRRYVKGGR